MSKFNQKLNVNTNQTDKKILNDTLKENEKLKTSYNEIEKMNAKLIAQNSSLEEDNTSLKLKIVKLENQLKSNALDVTQNTTSIATQNRFSVLDAD